MHTLRKSRITALNFLKSLLNTARPNIFIVRVNCYSYYMCGNVYESFKNFFFVLVFYKYNKNIILDLTSKKKRFKKI